MNLTQGISGLFALLLVSASAHATIIEASYTVDANATDPGLVIDTLDVAANPFTFDLNPGDSQTFDLFRIWTSEGSVNGDDSTPKPISVSFDFLRPALGQTSIDGSTVGDTDPAFVFFGNPVFSGFFQSGVLTWNGPADFFYGPSGDGNIRLSLSDEIFNSGFPFQLGSQGAIVQGTLTLVAQATVAAPNMIVMFAIAMLGLGLVSRRRRSGMRSTI